MSQDARNLLLAKASATARIFPWYAEMIAERQPEKLSDCPPMTADVLERHYYAAAPPPDAHAVYRTSGTSGGRRKAIVYSAEDERRYRERKVELFRRLTAGRGYKRVASDMGTGHAADTALAVFGELGFEAISIPYNAPVQEHVSRLTDYRPDLLYTMPSLLDALLETLPDPASLGLRGVLLVGESASRGWQRNAAALLGLQPQDIVDTYGCIELGTIAAYRHDIGRYELLDGLIAEGIQPAEAGLPDVQLEPGESILTLTSFDRELFPALRYVTYDVVRDLQQPGDGGGNATFAALVKRVGAELKHGEKISVHDIEEVVSRHVAHATVRVSVRHNRLSVGLRGGPSQELTLDRLDAIRLDLQRKLPEIASMIAGGLLDEIVVHALGSTDGPSLHTGTLKYKKLYLE